MEIVSAGLDGMVDPIVLRSNTFKFLYFFDIWTDHVHAINMNRRHDEKKLLLQHDTSIKTAPLSFRTKEF